MIPELEKRGVEKVIVFSHAATCIALSRALAGDLEGLGEEVEGKEWNEANRLECRAATCGVSKFDRKGEDEAGLPKWDRVWNGKTDFLKGGEERHWEFSFVEVRLFSLSNLFLPSRGHSSVFDRSLHSVMYRY